MWQWCAWNAGRCHSPVRTLKAQLRIHYRILLPLMPKCLQADPFLVSVFMSCLQLAFDASLYCSKASLATTAALMALQGTSQCDMHPVSCACGRSRRSKHGPNGLFMQALPREVNITGRICYRQRCNVSSRRKRVTLEDWCCEGKISTADAPLYQPAPAQRLVHIASLGGQCFQMAVHRPLCAQIRVHSGQTLLMLQKYIGLCHLFSPV